ATTSRSDRQRGSIPARAVCTAPSRCGPLASGSSEETMTMSETMNAEELRARLAQLEAIAAQLAIEAHTLRELGRCGQRALGEGEYLVDALWGIADRLDEVGDEIDRIAHRLDREDESA